MLYFSVWVRNNKIKIMDRLSKILQILNKYMEDYQKQWPIEAEHDIIWFNIDYELVSEEDMEVLKELGVFFDEDCDSLALFT